MRLDYISAFLLLFLLLCLSSPVVFAQEAGLRANYQYDYFKKSQSQYSDYTKNAISSLSIIRNQKDRFYMRSADISKYGLNVLSVSDGIQNVSLRTGISGFSKKAVAGIQLIFTW